MVFIPTLTTVSEYRKQQLPFTPNSSILAMNYGQDQQTGVYNAAEVAADLDSMWNFGLRKIRIGGGNYAFAAGISASKQLVLLAKSLGFYVAWGVVNSGGSFAPDTDANWPAYVQAVKDNADWAQANGVDEFQVGNEVEYSETVTHLLTDSVAKIKALGVEIKASHFFRTVSYSMAQSSMEYVGAPNGWIATGIGPFDKLGYNAYGDNVLTQEQARLQWQTRITDLYNTFGSSLTVTEWNCGDGTARPSTEQGEADEIAVRLAFLDSVGIDTAYFFTFRWDSSSTESRWALARNNSFKAWLPKLFTIQRANRQQAAARQPAGDRTHI